MYETIKHYQNFMLISDGVFCALLALFIGVIKFHSAKKKVSLLKIEIGASLMLIFEAFCNLYRGDISIHGIIMTRVSNFAEFILLLGEFYFINQYVTSIFMEKDRFKKLPKRLKYGSIIPLVGILMVVISQFTGMYYYFDANNVYQRGPLFLVSYIFPLVSLFLLLSFVIQHRKLIRIGTYLSLIFYTVVPTMAGIAQFWYHGLSVIALSVWFAAVLLFIFALIDQNIELAHAANTEFFTGLPNTYGYFQAIDRIIQFHNITDYNGFYFDIQKMGHINNKYGRDRGDEIIVKFAHIINNSIESDEIIGRLGGNYFVALIKKSNSKNFLKMLSDVPVSINIAGENVTVHVSAVAGGYEINNKKIVPGEILGYTSGAVTYAKNVAHKPYVFWDDEHERQFEEARLLEENAKKGLLTEEFVAFYQPKVDASTNILVGAEALVRWKKGDEFISPAEFIPMMERNGSICKLDFYVLERVCRDIRSWLANGMDPVTVSVNFSRKNLENPNLADDIEAVIEKNGISKNLIQIEITETIDEYPMEVLIAAVEALQSKGIAVAIDDFGTGSSSINLLKVVKFDVLKIDKSFIDYTNDKEKQLLADIIHMAKGIGINVIAEGVEQEEQVAELLNMNCAMVQGFVFDRPLERNVYEDRLRNKQYS